MGDNNTDLYAERRRGKDRGTLLDMMDKLKLVACGQAAWPRAHVDFVTRGGGSVHADSHIDYRADFLRIVSYGNAQVGVWVEKIFQKKNKWHLLET